MKKLTALALAHLAGELAFSQKGFDVKILNVSKISSICDFFVIASGEADVHVKAIARAIDDGLTEVGIKPYHREGFKEGNWILLDYIDVVIHVFQEPTRRFYSLEKLWGDASFVELNDSGMSRKLLKEENA